MEGLVQQSQILDLFLNIVRGFGLVPITNDYLRDSNGKVLLPDQIIAIQCKDVNMAVIISNDLSPMPFTFIEFLAKFELRRNKTMCLIQ